MARFSLALMGRPTIEVDGNHLASLSPKVLALLAFLACESTHPHTREELTGLLWPEQPEASARDNLRVTLYRLRQALNNASSAISADTPILIVSRDSIQFNPHGSYWLDVATFNKLIAESSSHAHEYIETCDACSLSLTQAVALYRDDFLTGVSLVGSIAFEEWTLVQREFLRRGVLRALATLCAYHEGRGDYEALCREARRQLALEPWHEPALRQLMRGLTLSGDRSTALTQYENGRSRLIEELGIEPEEETQLLAEQIRRGALSPNSSTIQSFANHLPGKPDIYEEGQQANPVSVLDHHNLPTYVSSFIGREQDLLETVRLLEQSRLVSLIGVGGCGKTRLAVQAATAVIGRFAEGVWLVELGLLADPGMIRQTIEETLKLRPAADLLDGSALLDYLRPRHVLIVLDNCEHLIEACATLVARLLHACPNLSILATSREPLGIAGEHVWPIPPLSVPEMLHEASAETLLQYESVRLFVERANAVKPTFDITQQNASAIGHICRRLDGIPLVLELAAARVKALTAEEIATLLEDRFHLLSSNNRTLISRHQTLRTTIEWSYMLLSPLEQVVLRHLAVFAGEFNMAAVERVAGGSVVEATNILDSFMALVSKSLVQVKAHGRKTRYRLLETIREYAWEELLKVGEETAVCDRHLAYFIWLAEQTELNLEMGREESWIEPDFDNLRVALERAIDGENNVATMRLVMALSWHWWSWHGLQVNKQRLQQVLAWLKSIDSEKRVKLLVTASILLLSAGRAKQAQQLLEEAVAIGQQSGDQRSTAVALRLSGNEALRLGNFAAAHGFFEQALGLWRTLESRWHVAGLLASLGDVALYEQDLPHAQVLYEENIRWGQAHNLEGTIPYPARRLGYLLLRQGGVAQAAALFKESLRINIETHDRTGSIASLVGLAAVNAFNETTVPAARILGAIQSLLVSLIEPLPYLDQKEFEYTLAAVQAMIDKAVPAWSEGRRMTLEEVVHLVLGDSTAPS